ncbi:VOC family protein [Flexistipes sp.]|uniref:VOC family protein n=1 Tax=Flexistipes sp. TaxID=3088135 RepID=UPI002E2365EA|nr:VOC family protein [Flexistipes sp.]
MLFRRIDHVEIVPSNMERTLQFYQGILGFETWLRQSVNVPPLQEIIYLKLSDTMLELLSVEDPDDPSASKWQVGYRMMALEVDDMDEAVNYLQNQGIEITWGPVDMGKTKRAEIRDPDGLGIELRELSR